MSAARDQYHHGNLREALVDAAQSLITDSGVAGLSLRKVAKHAGVSQAAPYHHFPNKDALLAEVARRGFLTMNAEMQATLAIEDAVARMEAMGRVYVAFGTQNPAIYRLMFGAEFCPTEDHPALKEAANTAFSMLVQAVHHGQQSGVFLGDEPGGVSMAVWSSMHGLVSLLQNRVHASKEMGGVAVTPAMMTDATLGFVLQGLLRDRDVG